MSGVLPMGRPSDLARAWQRLRAREAARKLGTSEAGLLASACGTSAVNLHVRETAIAGAFVVRKPTTDGIVTSLEVFDHDEDLIVQVFGKCKPGQPECARWRQIVEGLCGEAPMA
ncbi:MAG: ChuX/HutX family heme-like substrate-binding protein [Gammaproteobacteria bacterium]